MSLNQGGCRTPLVLGQAASAPVLLSAVFLGLLAIPLPAFPQAWTPSKGEGNISLIYQNVYIHNHFRGDGTRSFGGNIRSQSIVQAIEYGVTDKWAVSLSLPLSVAKYMGNNPHQVPVDNGNYHGGFADFRGTVRLILMTHPLVLTPFFAVGIPSHEYTYFAHSAIGTHQREYTFGLNAGRSLGPFLPRAYFQARYGYGVMEKVLGVRPNRSRLDGELGYFVTKRVSINTVESLQITHSGLDFPRDFPSRSDQRWFHHDQIQRINYLNLSVGLNYSLTESWDIFASLATTAWGQNGHAMAMGTVIGTSWSFRTRWAQKRPGNSLVSRLSQSLPSESPASTPRAH